jgi:hypothetical protein
VLQFAISGPTVPVISRTMISSSSTATAAAVYEAEADFVIDITNFSGTITVGLFI